ncbi:hypothetical protein CFC21_010540, partial [Triticum aestivum]
RSCNEASPDAPVLRWSFAGAAMELRRTAGSIVGAAMKPRRSCNGALPVAPVLLWNFAGRAGAALELRWNSSVLRWNFAGRRQCAMKAALELLRGTAA